MNDSIARRIVFLERELRLMGFDADDAERELRFNPTSCGAGQRLKAIYALAADVWAQLGALRSTHRAQSRSSRTASNMHLG